MSRYFFNVYNGHQITDDVGTECRGTPEVRTEAVEILREIIRERLLDGADTSSTTVNVTDRDGKTVMIVGNVAFVETVQGSSLSRIA